ncbi:MAG: tRNA 2-thiouridine(34) synthase MnmA, partial [Patescibacteria group bacterium]
FEVIGGFMKNWSDGGVRHTGLSSKGGSASGGDPVSNNDGSRVGARDDEASDCGWKAERRDAMRVAAQLGIPLHTFDFEKEYREKVYEYMIAEYKAGRTPNPDVLCNKYMKFDLFLRAADELGCDFVATGHYARVMRDENGTAHLFAGVDKNKDQSYFLCQLVQLQIARALFPIGHLEKSEVREIARKNNLVVAEKKDSQGICFVGAVAMKDFLGERIEEHGGNIVTTDGKVLGQHKGFEFYTIGQREGLGVGGRNEGNGLKPFRTEPLFVIERRPETNEVVVAVGDNDPALFKSTLRAVQLTEIIEGVLLSRVGKEISARIRYRQPLASCTITSLLPSPEFTPTDLVAEVRFTSPQRAVAPGQFVAFYEGDELLGSGVIL